MTAYTGIQGQNILIVSSDPSNPTEGQIWYNSTSNLLKGYALGTASWATGGNLVTATYALGAAGTQTATLAYGGESNPGTPLSVTQSYNGTAWSPVSSLNNARQGPGSAGTQTTALAIGGFGPSGPVPVYPTLSTVESWNGSSWTNITSMPSGRMRMGSCGTQTAALVFGGTFEIPQAPPTGIINTTLYWNGASWTSGGNLNTARTALGGAGTNTAALAFGGVLVGGTTTTASTESYNGTSWTSNPTGLNTARANVGGIGIQTLAVAAGGAGPPTGATETWNGSSWTNSVSMSNGGIAQNAGSGTLTAGLISGRGDDLGTQNYTEEYTGAALITKTITTS